MSWIVARLQLLLALMFVTAFAITPAEFEVFRLIQYKDGESEFGSQSSAINFPAVHFTDEIFRKVMMLRLEDITLNSLVDLLNTKPLGVLFLLPNVAQKDLGSDLQGLWISIQETLASHKIDIPIFFTFEREEILQLYNELQSYKVQRDNNELSSNILTRTIPYFEVKGSDPKLIDALDLTVLYGVLKTDEEIKNSDKPLILVSASYDYMTIASGMGYGINSASGLLAVLDLSKLFSQLMEDSKMRLNSKYDLMFVLTPGSNLGYDPTSQFIDKLNQQTKEKIKFVLCLDSIAYNNELTMHMGSVSQGESSFAKSAMLQFKKTAKEFDTDFKLVKKSAPGSFYEWEHLRYSEKGFFSGTLTSSSVDEPKTPFEKFTVFDTPSNFDSNTYEKNLKIIAEFLINISYPGIDSDVPFLSGFGDGSSLIDAEQQSHIIDFLGKTPRIPTELGSDSRLVQEILRIMKFHLKNIKSRRVKVTSPQYYQNSPAVYTLTAYEYQSRIIYILSFAAIIGAAYYAYQYIRYGGGSKVKKD